MHFDEVVAMPELDGWLYSGQGATDVYSFVCSSYVTAVYKHAGVFGDLTINPSEFATKDVYILDFWDTTSPLPEACVAADPTLPYCQLLGQYRLEMPEYNTVTPYDNMFQTCEINFPEYTRSPTC